MIRNDLLEKLIAKNINLHRIDELKEEIASNMKAEGWIFLVENKENSESLRDLILFPGYGMWENKRFALLEKTKINYNKLNEYFKYLEQAEALNGRNLVNMYLDYLNDISFLKDELTNEEKYPRYLASKAQIIRVKADNYIEELREIGSDMRCQQEHK